MSRALLVVGYLVGGLTAAAIVTVLGVMVIVKLARRFGTDEVAIAAPVQKFTGHDELLAQRTTRKRAAAQDIRKRAARVESGGASGDGFRVVQR